MQAVSRLASAVLGLAAAALVHAQGGPDELWNITSRMEMAGMPAQTLTQQVCMKKGETQPEKMSQDDNCKVTEQRRSGDKFTWKVVCSGRDPMTGTGEMTRSGDTLNGRIRMQGRQGGETMDMTVVYTGKRTGGCNAQTHQDPQIAAQQRQVAAMQAQGNAQIAQLCRDGIEKFSTTLFEMQGSPCQERKGEYCAHVKNTAQGMRTHGGYRAAMQKEGMGRGGWGQAARFCQVATEPVQAAACKSGMGARDWAFVADHCPAESKKLAAEHCAGRTYTAAMSSEYKAVCSKHASGFAQPEQAAAPAQPKPAADPVQQGIKEGTRALRKLFGN